MDLQARRRAATAIVVAVAAWFFMWFRRRAEEARSVTYGPMADRDQQRISNLKYIYDMMILQVQGNMACYVVYRGKEPRVYRTWAQCNAQVSGFKNNSYKSFPTEEEAVASYMEFKGFEEEKVLLKRPALVVTKTPCLFVVCMVESFVLVVLLLFIVFSRKKCL